MVANGEGRCYWHLVGRGQGCCQTSYTAQDSAPQQGAFQSKMPMLLRLRDPAIESNRFSKDYRHKVYMKDLL